MCIRDRSKIKYVKAKEDAKKGKVFARFAHEIMLAAKSGGGDPDPVSYTHLTISGLVFGMAISVASTVVLTRVLEDNQNLHTPSGHVALGLSLIHI